MTVMADTLNLEPNNLAFVFDSNVGVDAADLGLFLQRASAVSRRAGVDLYVVGLREGSLVVVTNALRKGTKAALGEFKSSPIRTTASAVALAGVAAAAIAAAMTPKAGYASPLAKAGAAVVENHSVNQISVITLNTTIIVMDDKLAAQVRAVEVERSYVAQPSADVRRMVESAKSGDLSGTVLLVDGDLHFRPDGFRYLVPIAFANDDPSSVVQPGRHIAVWGDILLRNSQPDLLVIRGFGRP